MQMMKSIFVALVAFSIPLAVKADCTDVIKLSKTVSSVAQNRESFESNAATFCSEYKKGTTASKSANYGISYKLIAASMGTANASAEEIASKVCSASSAEDARKDVYKQYVETISDKAYSAYEACERMGKSLNFSVTSILKKEITFTVGNASTKVGGTAVVQYLASDGINCRWQVEGPAGTMFKIAPGSAAMLRCTRTDTSEASAVTILDTSDGAGNGITVPWQALDKDGFPVDVVAQLHQKVDQAAGEMKTAAGALKGSVLAFNSAACPGGWAPYTPAFGKFIRGIDLGGVKSDPDGQRGPGAAQADSFATHSHNLTLVGRAGNKAFIAKPPGWGYDDAQGPATTATSDAAGGSETRPKNVALLYCERT